MKKFHNMIPIPKDLFLSRKRISNNTFSFDFQFSVQLPLVHICVHWTKVILGRLDMHGHFIMQGDVGKWNMTL